MRLLWQSLVGWICSLLGTFGAYWRSHALGVWQDFDGVARTTCAFTSKDGLLMRCLHYHHHVLTIRAFKVVGRWLDTFWAMYSIACALRIGAVRAIVDIN